MLQTHVNAEPNISFTPVNNVIIKPRFGHDLSKLNVLPKLTVNKPGDVYEQEADRVAEQVMRMPEAGLVQPSLFCDQVKPNIMKGLNYVPAASPVLQARETSDSTHELTSDLELQLHTIRGGGQPLPSSARDFFEPRFGYNLNQVRIHTDERSASIASSVHARAFTLGSDIVFASGQYAPGTTAGKSLLAHELVHVAQQRAGVISRIPRESGIDKDFVFSTNCGWIDWTHADTYFPNDVLTKVKGASAGSIISVKMHSSYHSGEVTAKILTSLTPAQQESVALGIFQTLSKVFERSQSDTDFYSKSSFSVEDLPSNLIGFYMAAKGYSKGDIKNFCQAWNRQRSKYRFKYDEKRGFFAMKNSDFIPLELEIGGHWPGEFTKIKPQPPGKLWTVLYKIERGPFSWLRDLLEGSAY